MRLRPRLSPVMDRFIAMQFFGPFMVCLAAFTAAYLLGIPLLADYLGEAIALFGIECDDEA